MAKITYNNKTALITNPDIADENKVTDNDMNEIKQVVNENAINISNEVDEDYRVNFVKSKNLFNANNVLNGMGIASGGTITSATDNGLFYIPVVVGKTYVFSFTDNGVSGNIVWGYTSQAPANGVSCTYNVMTNANLNGATFTPTGTQKYLCIRLNTSANNQYNAMGNIQCEVGSTATSYEPFIQNQIVVDNEKYSDTLNVGQFDSRSRVNVLKSKNLFNLGYYFNNVPTNNCTKEKTTTGIKLNFTAGADAFVGWAGKSGQTVNDVTKSYLIKVKPNTTYTIALSTGTRNSSYITYISNDFNVINSNYVPLNSIFNYTFTTASNCYYIALRFGLRDNSITTYTFADIRLNEGSTALPYEPYITPSIYVDNEEIYRKDNMEQYSTGEIRIGTWIDGKPLYRKVVQITMPSDTNYVERDLAISNVDNIMLNGKSFITNSTYRIPLNSSNSNAAYTCWASVLTNGKIAITNAGTAVRDKSATIIVEYTKKTD